MLCLGPKKTLSSPRLKLTAQDIVYQCSKDKCEDHSAIQAPQEVLTITNENYGVVLRPHVLTFLRCFSLTKFWYFH